MTIARISFAPAACALALSAALLSSCGGDDAPGAGGTKPAAGSKAAAADGSKKGGGSSAVLAYQMARQQLEKGDAVKAEGELRRALELDPAMAEAYFELGKLKVAQSSQKIWAKARDIDLLNEGVAAHAKAVELEPTNDEYLLHLGRAEYLKDDVDGALAHLQKAVELNPKLGGGWKDLGRAQVDKGDTKTGIASYRRALEINAGDARTHFLLAQALELENDLAGARAAYEESIRIDPKSYEVHGRLAQVCGRLGDEAAQAAAEQEVKRWQAFDERMSQRGKAVNENPDDPLALRRLGELYFEVGEWDKSAELAVRAAKIARRDWYAWLVAGMSFRNLRDYANATKCLKEAEFLAPDVLDPKLELARLYAAQATEASLASLTQLLAATEEAAAEDGDSLYFLAEVAREVGREDDAKRLFSKAAALGVTETPSDPVLAGDERTDEGEEPEEQ